MSNTGTEPVILLHVKNVSVFTNVPGGRREELSTNVPLDIITAAAPSSATSDGVCVGNPVRMRCGPMDVEFGGPAWVERQGLHVLVLPVGDVRFDLLDIVLPPSTPSFELAALDDVISDSIVSKTIGNFGSIFNDVPPMPTVSVDPLSTDETRENTGQLPANERPSLTLTPLEVPSPCDTHVYTAARRLRAAGRLASVLLTRGGGLVSDGLTKTANAAARVVPVREKPITVHPCVHQGAQVCKSGVRSAVDITGHVAGAVASMASAVGSAAGSLVKKKKRAKRGAPPITPGFAGTLPLETAQSLSITGSVLVVGAAAIGAGVDVIETAGEVGKTVLLHSGHCVANVVGHSLGQDAEGLTREGVEVAGGVYSVAQNMRRVGTRAMARGAGRAAVEVAGQEPE